MSRKFIHAVVAKDATFEEAQAVRSLLEGRGLSFPVANAPLPTFTFREVLSNKRLAFPRAQ